MPNLKGHIATAAAASGAAFYFGLVPDYLMVPALITGIGIGTIIPDLDHQSSTINQKILLINRKWFQIIIYGVISLMIVYFLGQNLKAYLAATVVFLTGFFPHRAFTHKPIGAGLICAVMLLFLGVTPLSIGIIVGLILHIMIDKIYGWLF